MAMETLWLATPDDLAKFRNDKSGRAATPASGTAPEKRYWHGLHSLMHKYLEQKKYSDSLAQTYQRFFTSRLVSPFSVVGEWTEVRIVRLMKSEMAYSAIASLLGTRILDTIPNLVDLAWDYDKVLANLLYGAPRWLFPGAHAAQRRILSACTRYYRDTSAEYDWDADEDEVDWEPLFGSRWGRETARWMRECEFDNKTCGGLLGTTGMMGLNASTVPITGWLVMELVKDPELFRVIRAEAETAYVTTESGERILDVQKVLSLCPSYSHCIPRVCACMFRSISVARWSTQSIWEDTRCPPSLLSRRRRGFHISTNRYGVWKDILRMSFGRIGTSGLLSRGIGRCRCLRCEVARPTSFPTEAV